MRGYYWLTTWYKSPDRIWGMNFGTGGIEIDWNDFITYMGVSIHPIR